MILLTILANNETTFFFARKNSNTHYSSLFVLPVPTRKKHNKRCLIQLRLEFFFLSFQLGDVVIFPQSCKEQASRGLAHVD